MVTTGVDRGPKTLGPTGRGHLRPTLLALVVALFGTLLVALAPLAPARGAAASGAVPPPCAADAVVVAVSGGAQGRTDRTGLAALGSALRPLAQGVVDRAALAGRTVRVEAVVEHTSGAGILRAGHPAHLPADRVVRRAAWRVWQAPVAALAQRLGSVLTEVAACPDQLVFLVGYSQGAQAVHRTLLGLAADRDLRSRLAGTVLVGDGARAAGGVSTRLARTPLAALPNPGWTSPLVVECARGDVVCDLRGNSFGAARRLHRSYGSPAGRERLATQGRALGARLALWPRPRVDQRVSGRVGVPLSTSLGVDVAPGARDDLRWRPTSALPPGVELSRRGRLSGSPTRAGTVAVAYTVANTSEQSLARPVAGRVVVIVEDDAAAQVSTGGRHSCSVRSGGTLWCWGANFEGQLGVGDHRGRRAATQVGRSDDWASVSGGGMHTCAIRTSGSLWCWGLNYRGQLGIGSTADQVRPHRVGTGESWASVSAGWVHTCATRTDGSAWCWGNNAYGQLGDGTATARRQPRRVAGDAAWSEVEAGGWHTCGVRRNGTAWCWGRNLNGELGLGDADARRRPQQVGHAQDWSAISPSWTHTCGLRSSGRALCWGSNLEHQLGTASPVSSALPVAVAGGHRWSQLSTGIGFSCGLETDATLWCWGNGRYGQIGTGAAAATTPVEVIGEGRERGWVGLDSGWLHSCAVRARSAPRCWGENEVGALGDREDVDRSAPRPVSFAANRTEAAGRMRTEPVDPSLGAPAPAPAPPPPAGGRAGGLDFQLVSFNVLGSNHSAPRQDAGAYSPARVRAEWAIDHLTTVDASIVGFSEIQRDQLAWFLRGAGERYDVWPGTRLGGAGVQTSIAWKQRDWALIGSDTVEIPFLTQQRLMPLVHLRSRSTGEQVWVMNVHNAPQGLQAQRNRAVELEIQRLEKVVGRGEPVFLVGDFNERERVFCAVGRRLGMRAPRGGRVSAEGCRPPEGRLRVDWIFGTPNASYSAYGEDRSPLVTRITDHAVLRTRVSLP